MRRAVGALAFLAVLGAAAPAKAAPAKPTSALQQEILKARRTDPAPFLHVSTIVSRALEVHAKARGRRAPVAQELARLGPGATLPMLEKLTSEQPVQVRRDLIEALGLLADKRSVGILSSILSDASEEPETTRMTSEALARIGTEEAANQLVASLNAVPAANAPRARAIVAGMGELRKLRVTEAIAQRARTGDEAMVRAASRALSRAGNAWAWQTLADRREEQKIRETAAKALVAAFVANDGEARQAASNALMVVDAPITPSLIAAARAASPPPTQAALDGLAQRFATNPAR